MNTLNMIKKQINKASALHDAQITHTSYRGVEYSTRCVELKEPHGTFCYRGKPTVSELLYLPRRVKTLLFLCLFIFEHFYGC